MSRVVKKPKPKITGVVVLCPTLGQITVDVGDLSFTAFTQECEVCGTHGSVEASWTCKCGKYHNVVVDEW